VLVLLVICLLPGLAAGLASRRFRPDPALAWWRALLTAVAVFGAGLLVVSSAQRWWTIDDPEREATLVTEGTSGYPIVLVAIGLLAAAVIVAGLYGHRNWAPMALTVAWLLVAGAWYASTGELHDSDSGGKAGPGLRLATEALLVVTLSAAFASLGRLAERGVLRRPVLSGWDVIGVTFFAVLYLAVVSGIVAVEGLGWLLLAVGLVAAAVRVAKLRAGARTGADASR
jgi:hypothetical protein